MLPREGEGWGSDATRAPVARGGNDRPAEAAEASRKPWGQGLGRVWEKSCRRWAWEGKPLREEGSWAPREAREGLPGQQGQERGLCLEPSGGQRLPAWGGLSQTHRPASTGPGAGGAGGGRAALLKGSPDLAGPGLHISISPTQAVARHSRAPASVLRPAQPQPPHRPEGAPRATTAVRVRGPRCAAAVPRFLLPPSGRWQRSLPQAAADTDPQTQAWSSTS